MINCVKATIQYYKTMIHNRIAVFRIDRDMSRKDLAAAVGVNPQTIGFLERGAYSPSVELALRLAHVLRAPVEALFSLTPFPALAAQLGGAGVEQEIVDERSRPRTPSADFAPPRA